MHKLLDCSLGFRKHFSDIQRRKYLEDSREVAQEGSHGRGIDLSRETIS